MTSLSDRFSQIKAVTVDSTESETDFSDDSLFPWRKSKTFSYSNTPTLSFTANFGNRKVGSKDEYDDEEDSDDEVLDMIPEWREHFQKILKRSKSPSGINEKHICLSDNVPEFDKDLPLKCLKDSIEQYSRLSQLSDEVDNNFSTEDDLILERSENEFDICDVNTSFEKNNKTFENHVDSDRENKVNSADVDKTYIDVVDLTANLEANIEKKVEDKSVTNAKLEAKGTKGDSHFSEIDTVKIENDNGLIRELQNVNNIEARNVQHLAQETVSKVKQDIHGEKHNENCKEIGELASVIKCNKSDPQNRNSAVVPETLQSDLSKNTESESKVIAIENVDTETNIINMNQSESELEKESKLFTDVHEEKFTKESNLCHENGTVKSIKLKKQPKNLKENKDEEKENENKICSNEFDKSNSKQNEKKESKRNMQQIEIRGQISLDKSNKDNMKNALVSQSKKMPMKAKIPEIKPALSFPLDELLPPVLQTESQMVTKENTEKKLSVVQRPMTKNTSKDVSSSGGIPNLQAPILYNEADVFHGTVYDNSPSDETLTKTYQDNSLENCKNMVKPVLSDEHTHEEELDTGMANLIAALQSGDQQVITLFQAALHDQIGSNLRMLASKARSTDQVTSLSERRDSHSFGFYTERKGTDTNEPDETGDNPTNEKYDDLFDLFVEQCSALVETEEDRSKLKYLMTLLQKEKGIKLQSKQFTPSTQLEFQSYQTGVYQSSNGSTPSETETLVPCKFEKLETDLFEGRTLLKGGVEPRHIPKTTVRKHGQERPKDPRVKKLLENTEPQVKLRLPAFAVELYGEKKVKRILHLDWDAQFSVNAILNSSANVKDPRVTKKALAHSEITLSSEATKTSIETSQLSDEAFQNKNVQENKTRSNLKSPSGKKSESAQFSKRIGKTKVSSCEAIPVLITPQKEIDTERFETSAMRNPVLRCIDLQNGFQTTEPNKQDKKLNIGIVKPLIEKQTLKDNKPSVGIVKPIQVKSASIKPKVKSKDSTLLKSEQSMNTQNSLNSEKSEKENKSGQPKTLPSRAYVEFEPIIIDSDSEEGEIKMNREKEKCGKWRSNTVSESHKNRQGSVGSKFDERPKKTGSQSRQGKVQNTKTIANFSDVSSFEDCEVDLLLDKSFNEKVETQKRHRDGKSKISSRSYRKRERSSSRSSVDSRISHSSCSSYRPEDRKYNHSSTSRNESRETSKSDRSKSGNISDKKGLHNNYKDINDTRQRHRHRHHTSGEDKSYQEYSNMQESSKRHNSIGNKERKRHKTEGLETVESYKKQYESKVSDTFYTTKKTRVSETIPYQYNDVSLSDEDISKEYHELFGKTKTKETLKSSNTEFDIPNKIFTQSEFQNVNKARRMSSSNRSGIDMRENKVTFQEKTKSRRKSSEDIQREVLEDKNFLENCKKKILGNSSKGNKASIPVLNKGYCSGKPDGLTFQESHPTPAQSSDLEEGEI